MTRTPLLRLAAAALISFAALSPALAQQRGKVGAAPEVAPLTGLSSLGNNAIPSLNTSLPAGTGVSAVETVKVPVLPQAVVAPQGAGNPLSASQNAAVQNGATAISGAPQAETALTLSLPEQAAREAWNATPLPMAQAQIQTASTGVRGHAERIASTLLSWGRSAEKTAGASGTPVAGKSSKFVSGLKRSMRAVTVSAALAIGMLTHPGIAIAQQVDPVRVEQQAQESRVLRASSMQDLIARWDPSVHVMVIGDLPGPAAGMVSGIQNDLKGTHVYVLLVADASNLRFTDDGRNARYENEAAEFGLGQGIGGKEAFHALVDKRTGASDGVLFLVSWGPSRYMAYGPSKTQLDAGLTIDAFKANKMGEIGSNLREPTRGVRAAVEALRTWVDESVTASVQSRERGAKDAIADAKSELRSLQSEAADFGRRHSKVRIATPAAATLQASIDKAESLLAAKRFDEARAEASGAAQSARSGRDALGRFDGSYRSAKDGVRSAAATVDALESATARFKGKHPKADGDLASPDLAGMRRALASLESSLESDPASAVSAASAVAAQADAKLKALGVFEGDAAELSKIQADIDANAKHPFAADGAVQRQAAQTKLDEAKTAYERGQSSYKGAMAEARGQAVAAAERSAQAESTARAERNALIAGIAIALGLLGALLTWLALLARPLARSAREQYAEKKTLLDNKLEAVFGDPNREQGALVDHEAELGNFDQKVETLVGPIEGEGAKNYKGVTAEKAASVRSDVGEMNVIFPAMEKVLSLAEVLIFPKGVMKVVNFFRRKPWAKGLKMLKDEPVVFTPADGLPQVFGKTKTWNDKLYGSIEAQKPFTSSFEELVAAYNTRAKRAAENLKLIETKIFALEPTTQAIEKAMAEAGRFKDGLDAAGKADGLFTLAPLFAALLPAAAASLRKLQSDHRADPVGAIDGSGAEAERMAADAKALAKWAEDAREAEVKSAYVSKKTLSEGGFDVAWLDKALKDLSVRADAAANKAVERSIASELKSLDERAKAIAAQAASAVEAAKRLATLRKDVSAEAADVDAARAELAAATGAPADKTLREKGFDPTKTLANASRSGDLAQEAISAGKTAEAEASLADGEKALAKAKKDVADARAAAAAQAATVQARADEHARITKLKPAREKLLAEIRSRFASSVLSLRSGDPAHPSANGTIDDNVDEAVEHLELADAKREQAVREFAAGNVLEAAEQLRQSAGNLALAQHRLDEISEKLDRLNKTLAGNAADLAKHTFDVDARKKSISDDNRSQEATREEMRKLRNTLAAAKDAVMEVKGDPFDAEIKLKAVADAMAHVDVMFKNDVDMYNEAARSLDAADRNIQSAANEASTAKNDGYGDSPAILQAYNDLEALRRAVSAARTNLGQPHGDWRKVDVEADRVAGEAAKVAATLRRETQAASEAAAAISNASSKVREATGWTGRYGVYIPGSPGSGELDRARSALGNGRYDDAKSYASSARSAAANAIAAAEAEVQRRYRAEQEELERQRRERERQEEERRAAARRAEESSRSSDSGMGGGSWSSGGSSSGMGGGSW